MFTQDRVILALTIIVLVAATAANLAHHKSGLAALCGGVLILVVIVRLVIPGAKALRESKDSQRR